ncbi:MAG: hypothetical protein H0V30_11220 [Chitinophagaceae bacterium]|jgi:uncharacterized protein YjiK|nr:hypothetical protein [Chitinophagaceae bacterium]
MVKNFIVILLVLGVACGQKNRRAFLPYVPGYNESMSVTRILPGKLDEISGLFYQSDGRMAAINDEEGTIFFVDFKSEAEIQESIEFGKKADYEEIVKVGNDYWVLESNGDLYQVSGPGKVNKYKTKEIKKTEFESMYHDQANNRLILLSKDHKEADRAILAYAFDLGSYQYNGKPIYEISVRDIHYHTKNSSTQCKPSGAAIHPILNKLFIVASVGKMLLQCTLDGKVEKAYRINPVKFQQPEGITFAPNGDMYISNEAAQGKATILMFPFENPL